MKAEFLFAGINVNIIIHKKSHFMDQGLKIRGIKYFNVETRLLFAPLSKFLATRLTAFPNPKMCGSTVPTRSRPTTPPAAVPSPVSHPD